MSIGRPATAVSGPPPTHAYAKYDEDYESGFRSWRGRDLSSSSRTHAAAIVGRRRHTARRSGDGFDTVAWTRTLPNSNGKVGMWGGSYLATTQLLAATLQPEGLMALFPSSSYNSRYDMVFQGGAFYLNDGLGWNLVSS